MLVHSRSVASKLRLSGAAWIAILLIGPAALIGGLTGPQRAIAQDLRTLPDDRLTPGVVASTDPNDVCGVIDGLSYSRRHRHTPIELKQEVYAAYGIAADGRPFEVDHRVPLCIGGADVLENLWPQEGWQHPNFHDKDLLEAEVCRMVCRDHSMTLQAGQAIFLGDWIAGYRQVFGTSPESILDRASGR